MGNFNVSQDFWHVTQGVVNNFSKFDIWQCDIFFYLDCDHYVIQKIFFILIHIYTYLNIIVETIQPIHLMFLYTIFPRTKHQVSSSRLAILGFKLDFFCIFCWFFCMYLCHVTSTGHTLLGYSLKLVLSRHSTWSGTGEVQLVCN